MDTRLRSRRESSDEPSKPRVTKRSKAPAASVVKRVVVQSIYPSKIIVRGAPSGEEYIWERAGSRVRVRPEDVAKVLEKNIVRGESACCGGSSSRTYLEVI